MIAVRACRLGRGVFATEPLSPGSVVLSGWGYRVPRRTRHSIQVDHETHMRFPSEIELLNHSCAPNCGVFHRRGSRVLEIHALGWIDEGDELTIDYATFEYEIKFMNDPCECGAPTCRTWITGYQSMPEEQRTQYGEYIAEYLREIDSQISRAM
jgi:uncharacterized protein